MKKIQCVFHERSAHLYSDKSWLPQNIRRRVRVKLKPFLSHRDHHGGTRHITTGSLVETTTVVHHTGFVGH